MILKTTTAFFTSTTVICLAAAIGMAHTPFLNEVKDLNGFQNFVTDLEMKSRISSHSATQETETARYEAFHLLVDGCGCSEVVLNELSQTPLRPEMKEHVVILSDEPDSPLLSDLPPHLTRPVTVADSQTVADTFHIESGPWLVVLERAGSDLSEAYSGGYANGQLSPMKPSRFAEIRDSLLQTNPQERYKGFGCSVGRNANSAKKIFEARKIRRLIQNSLGIKT